MAAQISLAVLVAALLAGLRYPGILIAGVFLSYQAEVLIGNEATVPTCLILVAGVQIVRWLAMPVRPGLTWLDFSLCMLLAVLLLSSLWSVDPEYSFSSAMFLIATVLLTWLSCRLSAMEVPKILGQMCLGLVVFGPVMAIGMLLDRSTGSYVAATRLVVEGGSAVGLAQPLPFVILAAIVQLITARDWIMRVIALSAVTVTGYATVVSSTRSVLLAVAIGAIIFVVSTTKLRRLPVIILSGVAVLFAGGLALNMVDAQTSENFLARITVNFDGGSFVAADASSLERVALQGTAFQMIADSPFLGYGYNTFGIYSSHTYPHNSLLEFMVSAGMLGALAYLAFLATLIGAIRTYRRSFHHTGAILLAMFAVVMVQSMVSFSFVMLKPLFIFAGLAAAGVRTTKLLRSDYEWPTLLLHPKRKDSRRSGRTAGLRSMQRAGAVRTFQQLPPSSHQPM